MSGLVAEPLRRVVVLEAVLERVTFVSEDTGYTVARVATDRTGPDLLTVVGPLLGAQVGESLRLTGHWGSHPRFGRQFVVESYTTVLPATIQGIRRYLGSGLIKGIGPRMAERMVDHFGADILDVIDQAPQRLVEVHGLGPKRTARIAVAWEEQKAIKEVMVFLAGVGVSTSLAVRIYTKYTDTSIEVVRTEPYRLASEVWGIGFKTADTIAAAVGIPHDSPERIKAGLAYTLSKAADDGHCYLPEPALIAEATTILDVPGDLVGPALDELVTDQGVIREPVGPPADGAGRGAGGVPGSVPPGGDGPGRWAAGPAGHPGRPAGRVPGRRLGHGPGLVAGPHRAGPRPRPAAGRPAGPDVQGGGVDRGSGLREELHGALGRGTGPGQGRRPWCWSPRPGGPRNGWPS